MLILRFDLLFPSLDGVKATARRLNRHLARPQRPIEPRELYRMQQELRAAQERIRYQVTAGRFFL